MSVSLYDAALLKKLQRWTKGTNITITGVDDTKRLFEVISDTNNDNPISLPLIALSRSGGYTILNKQKRPVSFSGQSAGSTSIKTAQINCIPVEIQYQIDIYTRYLEECDEYTRNFIFNIINYPEVAIQIPYEGVDITHHSNIRLTSEVQDNSSIPERLITGQFTRMSMQLNIDDAYLWDVRIHETPVITDVAVKPEKPPEESGLEVRN